MPDLQFALPRLAGVYDLENPWARDGDFYLALADGAPRRVLDLGCGTGTLACALAAAGHEVTGVDPAAAMLEVARAKPHADRVRWVEAPAQQFASAERFDWIVMTGHALQVFVDDADLLAVFRTMRRHLAAGGHAAFETRNPELDWVAEWTAHGRTMPPLPGGTRRTLRVTAAHGDLITFEQHYGFTDADLVSTSTLRFPSRAIIERTLADAGLHVHALYGDWEGGAFDPSCSREMIFICACP